MLHNLLEAVPQIGTVEWIGLSPAPNGTIRSVEEVEVKVGEGLTGDHHSTRRPGGKRQVTLIQYEHLPVVAALAMRDSVTPDLLRRNIVVSGINLKSLKKAQFRIGDVVLEGTGNCAPCSKMERNLGTGGYQAMRGHGGITARVLEPGSIRIGSEVHFIDVAKSK